VDVELDAVLAGIGVLAGVESARVVDARTGTVLSLVTQQATGTATGADDVTPYLRLVREAAPLAATGGGLDDLVVATRRAVHVLRSLAGSVVHVRLGPDGDVEGVRRLLASLPVPARPAAPRLPEPRHPEPRHPEPRHPERRYPEPSPYPRVPPVPRPRTEAGRARGGNDRQPALATLAEGVRPRSTGALAVLALSPDAPPVLPQRTASRSVPAPAVLQQRWANDADTLRRLVAGLRRLN
jgi:hypothetical protein